MADTETTTIRALCDRYKLVQLKLAYDLAAGPAEQGEKVFDNAVKESADLQTKIIEAESESPQDAAWILDVAYDELFCDRGVDDVLQPQEERARRLLKRAREIAVDSVPVRFGASQKKPEKAPVQAARDIVFDMEEDVRTLGEYAKVLLFVSAGCQTHGDATEAIERVAIDMIARGEQLETKYATLWSAVGIVAQPAPEPEAVSHD